MRMEEYGASVVPVVVDEFLAGSTVGQGNVVVVHLCQGIWQLEVDGLTFAIGVDGESLVHGFAVVLVVGAEGEFYGAGRFRFVPQRYVFLMDVVAVDSQSFGSI